MSYATMTLFEIATLVVTGAVTGLVNGIVVILSSSSSSNQTELHDLKSELTHRLNE